MPDKQEIRTSIAKIAKRLGRTPSLIEFVARAGISRRSVLRRFPKWNDAVRAAGLEPRRLYVRLEDGELLKDWGETARKKGAVPSWREYGREGKYHPRTLETRFGSWSSVAEAFRNFAEGNRKWADVVALPPVGTPKRERRGSNGKPPSPIPSKAQHARLEGRATYGHPLPFPGMHREPVNEQGVVLLFGILAKDLGYTVENVQKGFPDCEAMRQISPEQWQRVHIEFEFESKNFRQHGHPSNGCDVIVCWRHNWDKCPAHLEVVELSRVIKSLAS